MGETKYVEMFGSFTEPFNCLSQTSCLQGTILNQKHKCYTLIVA